MAKKGLLALVSIITAFTLAACGGSGAGDATQGSGGAPNNAAGEAVSGEVKVDGSSTVFPISQAVAEEFMAENADVNVTVGLSGSSNGFKAIINGTADIANASRTIKDEEISALKEKGEEAVQMPVAYDGITVVIHPDNTWATELTVEELKKLWEPGSTVTKWSQVREGFPDEEITLFGPGASSGTFEYFTEAINGEAKVSREDYTPSEDDNVLVQGVSGDVHALGYFGYAYYEENKDKLKAVSIKETADAPAVAPSIETIADGSYKPLSREIYIYPLKSALERPEVAAFLKFHMSDIGQELAEEVGYVRLPQELYDENLSHLPQ